MPSFQGGQDILQNPSGQSMQKVVGSIPFPQGMPGLIRAPAEVKTRLGIEACGGGSI